MKIPSISYRAVALIAIAVSAMGLVMSPVSAAPAYTPTGNTSGTFAYHHAFNSTRMFNSTQMTTRFQVVLTNLSQQGVDVSQPQADITAGNMTAAFQWLMAYHKANPDTQMNSPRQHAFNSTRQSGRIQSFVTKLGQTGVDVSQVQADLTSGNVNGAMQWMTAYHKAHPVQKGNGTVSHGSNSSKWQQGSSLRTHHAGFGNQTR